MTIQETAANLTTEQWQTLANIENHLKTIKAAAITFMVLFWGAVLIGAAVVMAAI